MQTVTRADPPTAGVGRGEVALLSAATVSRFADSAATVAVVLLVIARTGDAQLAGLVVAAFALPTLVTGPVLGAYLDRARAKRLVFAANQLLLAGTLAGILVLAGRVPGAVLIGLGLLAGLTAPVLTGGYSSLVPLVVPPGRLPRANAADAASYDVAGLGAPALIAAIASGAGAGPALTAAAGIAAAGLLLVLAAPMPPSSPGTGVRPAEPLAAALLDGLRLLWRVPLLRATTVATTLGEAAQGLLPVTLPLLAVQLGRPAAHGGWLLTAVSAGSLAGTLASVRLLALARPELVLAGALAAFGVLLAVAALVPTLTGAVAVAALAGIAAGPVLAATFAIRQRSVPAHRYAQAVASAASLKVGAFALGAAATGPLAAVLTARQLLLTVAAGQVLAVFTLLPRVRVRRP